MILNEAIQIMTKEIVTVLAMRQYGIIKIGRR